jgi:hypothetical protein
LFLGVRVNTKFVVDQLAKLVLLHHEAFNLILETLYSSEVVVHQRDGALLLGKLTLEVAEEVINLSEDGI